MKREIKKKRNEREFFNLQYVTKEIIPNEQLEENYQSINFFENKKENDQVKEKRICLM